MKWSPEEQEMLKILREKHGQNCWSKIAKQMNNVFTTKDWSDRQCRDKYINCLQITEDKGEKNDWSKAELHLLASLYLQHGSTWSNFIKQFPNKSLITIKNQFYNNLRKFCRTITNFQQNNFKQWRNFITYQNITSLLDLCGRIQKWIIQNGKTKCPQSKIFKNRDNILELAFSDSNEINEDFLKEVLIETRKQNKLLKCLGIFKSKSKGWTLNEKRVNFIQKFDRIIQTQDQYENKSLQNNQSTDRSQSLIYDDNSQLESLDLEEQSKYLKIQAYQIQKLDFFCPDDPTEKYLF